jgi:hypothetical protein
MLSNTFDSLMTLNMCVQRSSPLFTLPRKAKINAETLGHYPRSNLLTATQLISLHLLLHRPVDGRESDDPSFGPYISVLPRDFGSHPLTWAVHQTLGVASREECKLMNLLPPSVLAELLLLEKRFWTDWEAVRQYLVRSVHTIRVPGVSLILLWSGWLA